MTKPTEELLSHLNEIGWPDLKREASKLVIDRGEGIKLLEKDDSKILVHFLYYVPREDTYGERGGLEAVKFDADIDIREVLYLYGSGYNLNHRKITTDILQLKYKGKYSSTNVISISKEHSRTSFSSKKEVLKIPFDKFKQIVSEAATIQKRCGSYYASLKRHLVNRASDKYMNVETKNTTSISQGEFAFLTHRLNLDTKKKAEDYKKYLNQDDIDSLQELSLALIEKEVFNESYLRKLDAYFLKEKLKNIISLGNQILDLGTADLTTYKAQAVLKKMSESEEPLSISQLETLWQRYFERYLLYLIFTYREIHSKIKLNLKGDKKEPDFIGVNHYYGVDVIEIKTHLKSALTRDRSHDNFAFSSELSKAIMQTTNYIDAIKQRNFAESEDYKKITESTDKENLHRPRGIIVISSNGRLINNQSKYDQDKIQRDFTKLRNSFDNIEIITFDEVINIADTYSDNISAEWKE